MAITLNVYNQKAEKVGDISLSSKVFGLKINEDLVHQAMVAQQANERQVLAHTKGRGEVRGGGKKPWRQKGTGRARAGSSRSPIWRGGGVTFGPTKERNFKKDINKKMKNKALMIVLSDKVNNNNITIVDKIEAGEFKTKIANDMVSRFEKTFKKETAKAKPGRDKRNILIVNDNKDEKFRYSARNLAGVKIINLENINIVDLLKFKNIFFTKAGIKEIEKRYQK